MKQKNLYRETLMKHYRNPQNKVEQLPTGYFQQQGINPSCGDNLVLYIKLEDNFISDIKFMGEGCSICCSSTSILTDELVGKTKAEILNKIKQFEKLITGQNYDISLFQEAISYTEMVNFPNRHKCVLLPWQAMEEFLKQEI
ncbi:MAG: Fe-S cluster assembly sulfur transfer protein SufU [Mycoplasmatales bacterium]